jgi:hypothetical protein
MSQNHRPAAPAINPTKKSSLFEVPLIHSFVTFGRSHRHQLPSNAALPVMKAFQQAFPCHEDGAASG